MTHTTLLNFDIQEEKGSEQGKFSYLQVELFPSQMHRAAIISAVIRSKYDQDRMEAVLNNYIENPADEGSHADFSEMQSWRKMAKAVAKEALDTDE